MSALSYHFCCKADRQRRLEIGERTGLSAQTVSVLVRSLEHEGLVALGTAQKGRVGPPTVPIELNPEGAYSVGLSVGARHTDVVLIDFVGAVRFHRKFPNPSITPGSNHTQFLETIRKAVALLPDQERLRLAGVGMALPYNASHGQDEEAYFTDLQQEIEEQLRIACICAERHHCRSQRRKYVWGWQDPNRLHVFLPGGDVARPSDPQPSDPQRQFSGEFRRRNCCTRTRVSAGGPTH